ncbi:MAG TPA: SRPBCC family protein [Kiritimatiellia bacterium]|mgnify:CR=1 FL=1|nr:SRPBCC family protein [Kiritimatiellia bacterium]
MSKRTYIKKTPLPFPAQRVYDWHMAKGAFQRLVPPWDRVDLLQYTHPIGEGTTADFLVGGVFIKFRWKVIHENFKPGLEFSDRMVKGPLRSWRHTHRFIPSGPKACFLEDEVEYEMPFPSLTHPLLGWYIHRKLRRLFDYRHIITLNAILAELTMDGSSPPASMTSASL